MAVFMWLIGMFPGLPLSNTDMPAVLGIAMAVGLIPTARLRRRRDWLVIAGTGLLVGLGGLALTVIAALGLVWAAQAGAGHPPEFVIDFVLAVLTAILVLRFAFPWYERNGLLAREDQVSPSNGADDEKKSDTP